MALSRAGIVEWLTMLDTGLDSEGRHVVRIPDQHWKPLMQSILTDDGEPEPPAFERMGDYERDTRQASGCKVLLLLETASVPGRLEVELRMPSPPVEKMRIGRAGSVMIQCVRYLPAESLYVCRCCLVRFGDAPGLSTRAAVEAFIKDDTGLEWEQRETI